MKKFILAALAAVLLIGYPLSTYLLGIRVENTLRGWVDTLPDKVPYVKVSRNEYQRSMFKATHTVELQFTFPGVSETFPVTFRDEIAHGPIPDFKSIGLARVTHTLVLPPKVQQEVAKVLGDKPLISGVTALKFGGSGNTQITSPAFTYKDDRGEANWQGIEASFDFGKNFDRVSYTMTAPGFKASMKDGTQIQIAKIAASGQQDRMPETELIKLGKAGISVQSIAVTSAPNQSVSLGNIAYEVDTRSPAPSFVDVVGKFSAQNIKVLAEDWGSLEYTFGAKHLHAASLDALSKAMRDGYNTTSRRSSTKQSPAELSTVMTDAFKKHGVALLKHEPAIEIDKLRFGTEREYILLNANARIAGVTEAEIANPMQMISKLDARAEITLAEALLTRIASKVPAPPGRPASPAAPAFIPIEPGSQTPGAPMAVQVPEPMPTIERDPLAIVNAQVDGAVSAGYVIRGGGVLKSTISYSNGRLMINGRQFDGLR